MGSIPFLILSTSTKVLHDRPSLSPCIFVVCGIAALDSQQLQQKTFKTSFFFFFFLQTENISSDEQFFVEKLDIYFGLKLGSLFRVLLTLSRHKKVKKSLRLIERKREREEATS